MNSLIKIIEKLKGKDSVDSVFLTGSQGLEKRPHSDIDLVIIFKENSKKISSLYTWIDDTFADIFFFDHSDLEKIETTKKLGANTMDGIFVSWLEKATISFDKSGKLTELKSNIEELKKKLFIEKDEKDSFWQKINYNFVANKRYFESNNPLYHEALQIRLLYSVSEVITGYFEFRDIPWRGEKGTIKYLKENDVAFYKIFLEYTKAISLDEKFEHYSQMVHLVFTEGYSLWSVGDVLPQPKGQVGGEEIKLKEYWKELTS